MKFVHFGELKAIEPPSDWYLVPPRKKGMFAVPYGFVDADWINARPVSEPGSNTEYLLVPDGRKLTQSEFNALLDKANAEKPCPGIAAWYVEQLGGLRKLIYPEDKEPYMRVLARPQLFEYEDRLWHQLVDEVSPDDILDRTVAVWNGSPEVPEPTEQTWIKTSVLTFATALQKASPKRYQSYQVIHQNLSRRGFMSGLGGPQYEEETGNKYQAPAFFIFIEADDMKGVRTVYRVIGAEKVP